MAGGLLTRWRLQDDAGPAAEKSAKRQVGALDKVEKKSDRASKRMVADRKRERAAMKRNEAAIGAMTTAFKGFVAIGAAAYVARLAKAFTGFTASVIDANDHLAKLAKRTTVDVVFLQEMSLHASKSATSIDQLAKGVQFLNRAQADAMDGLQTATRGFDALGISMEEVRTLGPEEMFNRVMIALEGTTSAAIRTQAAMALLGRAGTQMLPMIDGFEEARDRAREFGTVLGAEFATESERFNDSMSDMGESLKGFALATAFGKEPQDALRTLTGLINTATTAMIVFRESATPEMLRALALAPGPRGAAGAVGALATHGRGTSPAGQRPAELSELDRSLQRGRESSEQRGAIMKQMIEGPPSRPIPVIMVGGLEPPAPPVDAYDYIEPIPDSVPRDLGWKPVPLAGVPGGQLEIPALEVNEGLQRQLELEEELLAIESRRNDQMASMVGGAMASAAGSMIQMIAAGESFEDTLGQIAKQLTIQIAQMLVMKAIMHALGLGGVGGVAGLFMERGGVVPNRPRYAERGMFVPRGSDTVPVMATPGEGILTPAATRGVGGVAGIRELNRTGGRGIGGPRINLSVAAGTVVGPGGERAFAARIHDHLRDLIRNNDYEGLN